MNQLTLWTIQDGKVVMPSLAWAPVDWDLIHWAQSPLVKGVTCDGKGCRKRHTRRNVRMTREGAYCVVCWRKLPRCGVCGNRASFYYSKHKPRLCAEHSPGRNDKQDIAAWHNEAIYTNTMWSDVVGTVAQEGEKA